MIKVPNPEIYMHYQSSKITLKPRAIPKCEEIFSIACFGYSLWYVTGTSGVRACMKYLHLALERAEKTALKPLMIPPLTSLGFGFWQLRHKQKHVWSLTDCWEKVQNLFQMPTCPLIDPFQVQFGSVVRMQIARDLNVGFLFQTMTMSFPRNGWVNILVLFDLAGACLEMSNQLLIP